MVTVTLDQIESQPREFAEHVAAGEDIVITNGSEPVARVSGVAAPPVSALYGSLKGKIWMAEDFEAPLDEFEGV